MPYLRANYRLKGVVADIDGAAVLTLLDLPTGYLAISTGACQLLMYMGDRFLAFTSTISTG